MIGNGGFETGNLNGWETIGDVSVQAATFGTGPRHGNYQAVLTTFDSFYQGQEPWEPSLPLSGNDPVGANSVESFLTLPAGTLDAVAAHRSVEPGTVVTSGSAMKQQFHATGGNTLLFYFNFLTDGGWGNANDFAFFSLVSQGFLSCLVLAGVESTTRSSNTVLSMETGYRRFSYTIPSTGDYVFGIGVVEMRDTWTGSAIAVDQFQLSRCLWTRCLRGFRAREIAAVLGGVSKDEFLHTESFDKAGHPADWKNLRQSSQKGTD